MGEPIGGDLCSGTYNGDTLPEYPAAHANVKITFGAGTALTSGVDYAIVVRSTGSGPANYAYWDVTSGSGYADGAGYTSTVSGTSWSVLSVQDFYFKTYTGAGFNVLRDSYTFADTGTPGGATTDTLWKAQSFTTTSSYTITAVNLELSRKVGSTPGTITVSIRATEGAPTKAENPLPTDANTDVTLDQATVTWDDGGGADTFDVYYGTMSGSLVKVSSAQAGTSFTVTGITDGSPYAYLSVRYWRIDSTNDAGTTTGDEWSFTTLRLDPPSSTYFYQGQYYRLLVQADGSYGDPPGTGVENVDYVYLAAGYEANFISTTRKLVAISENRFWYEDI